MYIISIEVSQHRGRRKISSGKEALLGIQLIMDSGEQQYEKTGTYVHRAEGGK